MRLEPMKLPPPRFGRSLPFAKALAHRRTTRDIDSRALPTQLLSNLVWAACGVNRTRGPSGAAGLTAASASNSHEIDVFAVLDRGTYLFQPALHRLVPVVAGGLRPLARTPGQAGVTMSAPVQLVFVVDIDRLTHTHGFDEPGLHDPAVQKSYYFVDTELIAGNVYLFAASHRLAAWFHNCDRAGLKRRLGLGAARRVLFAQSVGYAAAPARPARQRRAS